jgi:hypothetical protein
MIKTRKRKCRAHSGYGEPQTGLNGGEQVVKPPETPVCPEKRKKRYRKDLVSMLDREPVRFCRPQRLDGSFSGKNRSQDAVG